MPDIDLEKLKTICPELAELADIGSRAFVIDDVASHDIETIATRMLELVKLLEDVRDCKGDYCSYLCLLCRNHSDAIDEMIGPSPDFPLIKETE
jgi:hypothetical protein